jgi:hypothetical protein
MTGGRTRSRTPISCGSGESVVITDAFNAIVRIGETGGDPEQDVMVTVTSQPRSPLTMATC